MSKKHERTLEAIFKLPVQSGVSWKDCEKLLKALGAEISEGGRIENQDRLKWSKGCVSQASSSKRNEQRGFSFFEEIFRKCGY